MLTKAKVILLIQLVTLVLADVSPYDAEVSGIAETEEIVVPTTDDTSVENAMETAETFKRRYYYPRAHYYPRVHYYPRYYYPRYTQSYAPTRRYYNNYYQRPQYTAPNRGSYPAYRPAYQPQYYYSTSSSSDSDSSPPHIPDPPHIPNDPPQDFSHLHYN
ncbi:Uncharacterized protein APZ42_022146 [Daphnia magna]|uniref:Uncharacterized protein n=1 Tax=Daphnia magna TaxID=35525 RepID=A0A164W346_9CRUS|nr:Uncharacterized protein APZ42_022146 [Daphnia magna]